ncbi:hypothetical protein AB0B51_31705, partial [Streptomyces griseus]|uniref:hypothetical protein n=1 Tax=Streptomyces griseus TaxID=1911 RepID=UPI00346A7D11
MGRGSASGHEGESGRHPSGGRGGGSGRGDRSDPAALAAPPRPVRLASGADGPVLICLSTITA